MPDALDLIRPAALNALPGVVAAFTTRHGGVSAAPFGSLNLAHSTGDDAGAVDANRARVLRALGFPPDALAVAGQVHGNDVRIVDAPGLFPAVDGLATRTAGVLLGMVSADCAIVLLADAQAGVVGACHAGWRGAVAGVAGRTIDAMGTLGAEPGRMRAFVAPCISREAFEVGDEVAERFDDRFVHRPAEGGKPHVDLQGAVVAQLRAAGLPAESIERDARCTMRDTDTFYSYRAEDGRTGRMMGLVGMLP